MLITESMFLLLIDDDGRSAKWGTPRGYGLAGALMADLAAAERISLSGDKDPRVTVVDATPTGNPLLDHGLERVSRKAGKKISVLVQDGKLNPQAVVAQSLHRAGVIELVPARWFGLLPAKYPVINPIPEQHLRQRLHHSLLTGQADVETASILAILNGLGVLRPILRTEAEHLNRSELKQRLAELHVQAGPEGQAVQRAVQAVQAAAAAAVAVAVFSGTGS